MFCDPMHGGNSGMIGWQMIGFPGPRMSYFDDVDRHYGTAFRQNPASLAQMLGRPVDAWRGHRNMKTLPPVDVAIVGGGWTGLTMAKELATRTGLKILVLERGGPHKTRDYLDNMDELDYAIRLRTMQPIRDETVTLRHGMRDRALPIRQYGSFLPGTGVGGSGEHWSGISYRYYPHDFRRLSHIVEKYGRSKVPEDCTVRDWPHLL